MVHAKRVERPAQYIFDLDEQVQSMQAMPASDNTQSKLSVTAFYQRSSLQDLSHARRRGLLTSVVPSMLKMRKVHFRPWAQKSQQVVGGGASLLLNGRGGKSGRIAMHLPPVSRAADDVIQERTTEALRATLARRDMRFTFSLSSLLSSSPTSRGAPHSASALTCSVSNRPASSVSN